MQQLTDFLDNNYQRQNISLLTNGEYHSTDGLTGDFLNLCFKMYLIRLINIFSFFFLRVARV